jgi:hypothetical protein
MTNYLIFGTIILILITCLVIFNKILKFLYHYSFVNKHQSYVTLLEQILDKSYDSVYKDQVIAYSASAIRPEKEQLETIKRNYIKLSFELMGPNVENILVKFYGDRSTLIKAMLVYMETRLDADAIMEYAKKIQENQEEPNNLQGLIPEGMDIT